mgnify:CR=1 FL=1|jgi:hypothetical protein
MSDAASNEIAITFFREGDRFGFDVEDMSTGDVFVWSYTRDDFLAKWKSELIELLLEIA